MENANGTKVIFPEGIFYDCNLCGKCCKTWLVTIDSDTCRKLKRTWFYRKLKKKYPGLEIIKNDSAHKMGLIAKIDNECVMLENNLCQIHGNLGCSLKPLACRMFPFIFGITPRGFYMGVSYHCPMIRENKGIPLEGYSEEIQEIIKTGHLEKPSETLQLTSDLAINWDGYFFIEEFIDKCITNSGALLGTWEAMSTIAAFALMEKEKNRTKASMEDITRYFQIPPPALMKRDEAFNQHQVAFTGSIITILELWDRSMKNELSEIVLNGGVLQSDTFEKEIKVKPFSDYLSIEPPLWDEPVFLEYMKHLLWRKHLNSFNTIFQGVTALHFMPLIFCWYSNASAVSENRSHPTINNMKSAMGIIDLYFHHLRHINMFYEKFAGDILERPGFFFDL